MSNTGPSNPGATTIDALGTMELTISGLDGNNVHGAVRWLDADGHQRTAKVAAPASLTPGMDIRFASGSVQDVAGSGGSPSWRYVSVTFDVRNADFCSNPGNCTASPVARSNLVFIAATTPASLAQTSFTGIARRDGTPAPDAAELARQLMPTHGMTTNSTGQVTVSAPSLLVFREDELPAAAASTTGLLPYGYAVTRSADGSRTLPANPAPGVYDGSVTFGLRIPKNADNGLDPATIALRLQAVTDANVRVVQSREEQDFAGDKALTARAVAADAQDRIVLGGRIAQVVDGEGICSVRTAGAAAAATDWLVTEGPQPPKVVAAPMNLTGLPLDANVSLGFCQPMAAPTEATLVVHGSQSGMRRINASAPYRGTSGGGAGSTSPYRLTWSNAGQRPFFPGETVEVTATGGNKTTGNTAIAPFVGRFTTRGSVPGSSGSFSSPASYPVDVGGEARPQTAVMGDVNGDGRLDVVTAHSFAPAVTVMLGDGSGGFSSGPPLDVGSSPQSIALGEVNGDGFLDIVVATPASHTVTILLGNGSGGFSAGKTFETDYRPNSVRLGDINGDGYLDIVTASLVTEAVTVLLGDGSGGFSRGAGGSVPHSGMHAYRDVALALGDVNGDGRLDLVAANYEAHDVMVLLGDGTGGFSAGTSFSVGSALYPKSVELGDLNNDGILDIVTTNFSYESSYQSVTALLGNGSGGFSAAISSVPADGLANAVALGDLNGDGFMDIVAAGGG